MIKSIVFLIAIILMTGTIVVIGMGALMGFAMACDSPTSKIFWCRK